MTEELIIVIAAILAVAAAGAAAAWFARLTPEKIRKAIANAIPGNTYPERVAIDLAVIAHRAVEQRAAAWGTLTNQQRIDLFKGYLTALIEYQRTGTLSDLAAEAYGEFSVWVQKHAPDIANLLLSALAIVPLIDEAPETGSEAPR